MASDLLTTAWKYNTPMDPLTANNIQVLKDINISRNVNIAQHVFEFDFVINKTWIFSDSSTAAPIAAPANVFVGFITNDTGSL